MHLETMTPNPVWDPDSYGDAVETLREHDDLTFLVWGGDWCKDCRALLPDFGAALEAAGVPDDRVEHLPVEKAADGSKRGPRVAEFDVERIPTVVVRDGDTGQELARFVEDEGEPVAVYLAERIRAARD